MRGATMRKSDQMFGTLGMAAEWAGFAAFTTYFAIARTHLIGGIVLPIPRLLVRYALMSIFISIAVSVIGVFCDKRRSRAMWTLVLIMPMLIVMGILNGNW
jgi:hypothetical protein